MRTLSPYFDCGRMKALRGYRHELRQLTLVQGNTNDPFLVSLFLLATIVEPKFALRSSQAFPV